MVSTGELLTSLLQGHGSDLSHDAGRADGPFGFFAGAAGTGGGRIDWIIGNHRDPDPGALGHAQRGVETECSVGIHRSYSLRHQIKPSAQVHPSPMHP